MKADSVATLPRWSTLLLLLIPKAREHLEVFRTCRGRPHDTEPGESGRIAEPPSGSFRAVLYKRAWMLTMLLCRDQGIIRCLLECVLAAEARGIDALHAWYDERMFPSQESELPVDKRMLSIGEDLFRMPQCTEAQS